MKKKSCMVLSIVLKSIIPKLKRSQTVIQSFLFFKNYSIFVCIALDKDSLLTRIFLVSIHHNKPGRRHTVFLEILLIPGLHYLILSLYLVLTTVSKSSTTTTELILLILKGILIARAVSFAI